MLTNEKVILRIFEPADIEPVYILVMDTIDKSYTSVYPEEAIRFFKQYHRKENIYDDYLNGYTIIAELEKKLLELGHCLVQISGGYSLINVIKGMVSEN
ncbi:MAG: hypothetical protein KBA08_03625 [Firmicutes bacterium]|nr:hypothetical protein [Bacillota bacterium]